MHYHLRSSATVHSTDGGISSSASGLNQDTHVQASSLTEHLIKNTGHHSEANERLEVHSASAVDSPVSNAEAEDSRAPLKQGSSALVPDAEETLISGSRRLSTEAANTTGVVHSTNDVSGHSQIQTRSPDRKVELPRNPPSLAERRIGDLHLDIPARQLYDEANPRPQEAGAPTVDPTHSSTVLANMAPATSVPSTQTLERPAYLAGIATANAENHHKVAAARIFDGSSISPRACDECKKKNQKCIINPGKSIKCCWCVSTAYSCNAAGTKPRPRPANPALVLPDVNYSARTRAEPRARPEPKPRNLENVLRDVLQVENETLREGLDAQKVKTEEILDELRNLKRYVETDFKRKRDDNDVDDGDEDDEHEGQEDHGPRARRTAR